MELLEPRAALRRQTLYRAAIAVRLQLTLLLDISRGRRKSDVPDTFQLGAISEDHAFCAYSEFSNLRVFNTHENSDSPRLQKFAGYGKTQSPTILLFLVDFAWKSSARPCSEVSFSVNPFKRKTL
jgi:hypothetical protein